MNIKGIRLRNFRGFVDAPIELKPLTVLLGPNSAGKSSFGQALAAMAHVHRSYRSTPQASLTPPPNDEIDTWPVDLGKTNDLRTEKTEGPVKIDLQTTGGVVELGFGGVPRIAELILSYIAHPSGDESAAEKPSHKAIESVPQGQLGDVVPFEGAFHKISSASDLERVIRLRKFNEQQWLEVKTELEDKTEVSVILDGLVVKAVTHMTGTPRKLSGAASDDLRSFLENLTYLRANRKRPARGYKDGAHRYQPIGYSGQFTPSILLMRGTEQVSYCEPPAIPNTVEEARKFSPEWKETREMLRDALNAWLSRLELARRVETVPPSRINNSVEMRVALEGQSLHDITEIGFGISQVVPILVAGLLQPKNSLLVVDLPEAHLHPRPQGAIADFFCSLVLSGRSALVETHSEMFFHRLRLRAAMDPGLLDKIAVYFIDEPKNGVCSNPRPVGLGYEEELRWPEGFLQEAWETETQINAVREAQRLARE